MLTVVRSDSFLSAKAGLADVVASRPGAHDDLCVEIVTAWPGGHPGLTGDGRALTSPFDSLVRAARQTDWVGPMAGATPDGSVWASLSVNEDAIAVTAAATACELWSSLDELWSQAMQLWLTTTAGAEPAAAAGARVTLYFVRPRIDQERTVLALESTREWETAHDE